MNKRRILHLGGRSQEAEANDSFTSEGGSVPAERPDAGNTEPGQAKDEGRGPRDDSRRRRAPEAAPLPSEREPAEPHQGQDRDPSDGREA